MKILQKVPKVMKIIKFSENHQKGIKAPVLCVGGGGKGSWVWWCVGRGVFSGYGDRDKVRVWKGVGAYNYYLVPSTYYLVPTTR